MRRNNSKSKPYIITVEVLPKAMSYSIRLTRKQMRFLLSFILASVIYAAIFLAILVSGITISVFEVEDELTSTVDELEKSKGRLENEIISSRRMLESIDTDLNAKNEQLKRVQKEIEVLRALAEKQEKIAQAHREILLDRTLPQRLQEIIFSFIIGVSATLAGSLIIFIFANKRNCKEKQNCK